MKDCGSRKIFRKLLLKCSLGKGVTRILHTQYICHETPPINRTACTMLFGLGDHSVFGFLMCSFSAWRENVWPPEFRTLSHGQVLHHSAVSVFLFLRLRSSFRRCFRAPKMSARCGSSRAFWAYRWKCLMVSDSRASGSASRPARRSRRSQARA